jgi:hypothetical protein
MGEKTFEKKEQVTKRFAATTCLPHRQDTAPGGVNEASSNGGWHGKCWGARAVPCAYLSGLARKVLGSKSRATPGDTDIGTESATHGLGALPRAAGRASGLSCFVLCRFIPITIATPPPGKAQSMPPAALKPLPV